MVTDKDRREWAFHPVTQELLQTLLNSRAEAQENWARERFCDSDPHAAAVKNAAAIGGIRVVDQMLGMVQDFKNITDDGQLELI